MTMLTWSDSLSVNVEEIDLQHQSLVDMVNRLHDAMVANRSKEVLESIVGEMRNYAGEHFSTEERYMRLFEYPGLEEHRAEHAEFMDKAAQVEQDYRQGRISLSMDVLNFLSNWLVTHINGTDKTMGAFLQQQGAS